MSPDVQSRDVTTGRGAGVGGTCSRQGDCGKRNLFGTRGRWLVGGLSEKERRRHLCHAFGWSLRSQAPQPRSGAPQAPGLTAVLHAEAQLEVPSVAPTRMRRPAVSPGTFGATDDRDRLGERST